MMKAVAAFGSVLLLASSPAHAQWLYQGNESAFGDDGLHVALTASGLYALGLRCRGQALEVVYMTPDASFDDETYKFANIMQPKLRIRVDDDEIVDLEAELIDVDGKAAAIADVDPSLVKAVRGARRRVAVVMQLINESFHEQSFSVRGSTRAVDKMSAACGLED